MLKFWNVINCEQNEETYFNRWSISGSVLYIEKRTESEKAKSRGPPCILVKAVLARRHSYGLFQLEFFKNSATI